MKQRVRQTPTTESESVCEECESDSVSQQGQEVICEDCGLVLDEYNIDHGPEWRSFNAQDMDEKSRVGSPLTATMHDRGLSTVMGHSEENISQKKQERMDRLREWDTRSKQTSKERGLKFTLGEIQRLVSALELSSSIHEDAATVFREAHREGLAIGRSFEGMASASVYIACRRNQIPRTVDEVSQVSRVEKDKVIGSYKKMLREMSLPIPPVEPEIFISRFVNEIRNRHDMEPWQLYELRKATKNIVKQSKDVGLHNGRDPATVVAGAIYIASKKLDLQFSQSEVGEPCNVNEVSVRSMYRDQADELMYNV